MHTWHASDESDLPLWVRDLDDDTYGVGHRRLCVWPDEFDGTWHWEIQTYEQDGATARGDAASRHQAIDLAEAAARHPGRLVDDQS